MDGKRERGLKMIKVPTSSDIYLEIEGKKVAVAQSYNAKVTSGRYDIELTRLYATDEAIRDGLNFHEFRSGLHTTRMKSSKGKHLYACYGKE